MGRIRFEGLMAWNSTIKKGIDMGNKNSKEWSIETRENNDVWFYWETGVVFKLIRYRHDTGMYFCKVYTEDESLEVTPQQLGVGLQMVIEEYERFSARALKANAEHAKKMYDKYVEEDNG